MLIQLLYKNVLDLTYRALSKHYEGCKIVLLNAKHLFSKRFCNTNVRSFFPGFQTACAFLLLLSLMSFMLSVLIRQCGQQFSFSMHLSNFSNTMNLLEILSNSISSLHLSHGAPLASNKSLAGLSRLDTMNLQLPMNFR